MNIGAFNMIIYKARQTRRRI